MSMRLASNHSSDDASLSLQNCLPHAQQVSPSSKAPLSLAHLPNGQLLLLNTTTNSFMFPPITYPPASAPKPNSPLQRHSSHPSFPPFPVALYGPKKAGYIPFYCPSNESENPKRRKANTLLSPDAYKLSGAKKKPEFSKDEDGPFSALSEEEIKRMLHSNFVDQWRCNISSSVLQERRKKESTGDYETRRHKCIDALISNRLERGWNAYNFKSHFNWESRISEKKKEMHHVRLFMRTETQTKQRSIEKLKLQCGELPRVYFEMLMESKMAERGIRGYEILMEENEYGRRDFISQCHLELMRVEQNAKQLQDYLRNEASKVQKDMLVKLEMYKQQNNVLKQKLKQLKVGSLVEKTVLDNQKGTHDKGEGKVEVNALEAKKYFEGGVANRLQWDSHTRGEAEKKQSVVVKEEGAIKNPSQLEKGLVDSLVVGAAENSLKAIEPVPFQTLKKRGTASIDSGDIGLKKNKRVKKDDLDASSSHGFQIGGAALHTPSKANNEQGVQMCADIENIQGGNDNDDFRRKEQKGNQERDGLVIPAVTVDALNDSLDVLDSTSSFEEGNSPASISEISEVEENREDEKEEGNDEDQKGFESARLNIVQHTLKYPVLPNATENEAMCGFLENNVLLPERKAHGKQRRTLKLLQKGAEMGGYARILKEIEKSELSSKQLLSELKWLDETCSNRNFEPPSQDTSRDGSYYTACIRKEIQFRELLEAHLLICRKSKRNKLTIPLETLKGMQHELLKANSELFEMTLKLDLGRYNLLKKLKLYWAEINSKWNAFPPLKRGYRLMNMLGKGGFAEVWEVFDPLKCTIYAAKLHMLSHDMSDNERNDVIKRVKNEIDIHKVCRAHSNIVDMKACFQMDGNLLATILELCEGGDLDKYIKAYGPVPERLAAIWTKQILAGLLHMKNLPSGRVHHCDLKPGNILRHKGFVKLSDFGLSKIVKKDTTTPLWTGGGTLWYQPPECIKACRKSPIFLSDKIDVWAVGCILFEMLYAQRPFSTVHSSQRFMEKMLTEAKLGVKFPVHPPVSENCKSFVQSLLCFDAEKRYSIEEAMSEEFLKAAEMYDMKAEIQNLKQEALLL